MRLVIQSGGDVQTRDLKNLARLAEANRIEQITARAFCLRDAQPNSEIAGYCASAGLDFAFVPDELPLRDFRLLAMDMDSTLITIECIDEIADLNGLRIPVAEITEASMRGEIDFAESLMRRVALLEGLAESALQRVYDERLRLSHGAEKLMTELKRLGVKTLLVSGGFSYFTARLQARLGIDYTASNNLEIIDGKLTGKISGRILDAQGKADALIQVSEKLGLQTGQTIAVGDGANDLRMMEAAGISIAYRAKPLVQRHARYALNHSGLDSILNLFT